MSTQLSQNCITCATRAAVFSLAGMTALFFACDTHTITNPDSMEEVETAIGAMTEEDASPLFIVNGEIVPDISHIDAADIETVRLIRGSDVTAFRLNNITETTSGRLHRRAEAFYTVHGQEAEGRRMIFRDADADGQKTEGTRMIFRGEDAEPGQESEGHRIIRNPDAEHFSGQPAMLRSTTQHQLDDELTEKISGHPKASNGIVIINLRTDDGDASGSEK